MPRKSKKQTKLVQNLEPIALPVGVDDRNTKPPEEMDLPEAIRENQFGRVKDLLQNYKQDVTRMFQLALSYGRFQIVKHFLENYRIVSNAVGKDGWRFIHYACSREGSVTVVRYLVEKLHCDPMAPENNGNTPLHLAIYYFQFRNNFKIIKYLIEQCHVDIGATNNYKQTPLHYACAYGRSNRENIWAIVDTSLELVQYLLENGADPEAVDEDGCRPLDLASNDEIYEYLVR